MSSNEASSNQEAPAPSTQQQAESTSASAAVKTEGDEKSSTTVQPLAPPPKPSETQQSQPQQTPDYFGAQQNGGTNFSLEPNPFEQSFGNPSSGETPGKLGGLPSVASLTSPAPLGPGGTPNWQNSLRSGPLSPAMLQGPVNNNPGYFDQEFRNNYPTPNESSLRTGLTPGGGGSMFSAPSPNTQAIFNNLNGGQATPNTAEFQGAAARATKPQQGNGSAVKAEYQPAQQQGRADQLGAHQRDQQESDAVNSLFMLAQNPGNRQGASANQFATSNQQHNPQLNTANMGAPQRRMQPQQHAQHQQQSPTQHRQNGSIDMSVGSPSDAGSDGKRNSRAKGKKGSASKGGQAPNGRKKTDDTPSKPPAKKRSRGNNGSVHSMEGNSDEIDSDDMDMKDETAGANGNRKMTDEEKRKNFLERNRIAALKCRQRKKQWLANLQTKVEIYTQENDALTSQLSHLREEVINLKTLLVAHKDCPVSHQQGLGGSNMAQFMGSLEGSGGGFGMVSQGGMHIPHMGGNGMSGGQGVQRG